MRAARPDLPRRSAGDGGDQVRGCPIPPPLSPRRARGCLARGLRLNASGAPLLTSDVGASMRTIPARSLPRSRAPSSHSPSLPSACPPPLAPPTRAVRSHRPSRTVRSRRQLAPSARTVRRAVRSRRQLAPPARRIRAVRRRRGARTDGHGHGHGRARFSRCACVGAGGVVGRGFKRQ